MSWAGLCYSWAAAALLEREPLRGGIYEDVPFYVGDKKGLLTAAYDRSFEKSIRVSIGTPLEFHQALENYIAREGTGFIMDLGAQGQVWNYPVFRYDMTWTEAGARRTYLVTIHYVTDDVYPDYVGSRIETRTLSLHAPDWRGPWSRGRMDREPPCDVAYKACPRCRDRSPRYGIIRRIASMCDDRFEPRRPSVPPSPSGAPSSLCLGRRLRWDDPQASSLVTFSADEPSARGGSLRFPAAAPRETSGRGGRSSSSGKTKPIARHPGGEAPLLR